MSATSSKKKSNLFSKIESRAEALKIVKDISITFMVWGVIEGAIGFFLIPDMLYDAALYIVLGLILLLTKSRIAAVLLMILSGFSVFVTFTNMLGFTASGGGNVVVAMFIFFGAIKAVDATFKLHGRFAHALDDFSPNEPLPFDPPKPTGLGFSTLEKALAGLAFLLLVGLIVVVLVVIG